jgi:serine/threonine-protein kinase
MALQTGTVLNNRYRIVSLLGEGGYGAVYKAWDLNLNSSYAVKENFDTSPEATRQFEREAFLLANLRHPNLPVVHDHFIILGQGQYLVMDFIDGEDLQTTIETKGPLRETDALRWMSQVLDALEYLHTRTQPIIHRDVKPANIRITPDGKAVLVDFGISKVYDPLKRTSTVARAVTPGYSPYEQYGSAPTGAYSDIYAAGATLYTLLSGQVPVESIQRVMRDPLLPIEKVCPKVSSTIAIAIGKALSSDILLRPQSAAEFKSMLAITSKQAGKTKNLNTTANPSVPKNTTRKTQKNFGITEWFMTGVVVIPLLGVLFIIIRNTNPNTTREAQVAATIPAPVVVVTDPPLATQIHSVATTSATSIATQTSLPSKTSTSIPLKTPTATIHPGATITSPRDGMTMAYVPAGEFHMGAQDSQKYSYHKVFLDAFWIDKTEVTNAMFAKFVKETDYKTEAEKIGSSRVVSSNSYKTYEAKGAFWKKPRGPISDILGKDNHPVVQVSWNDAEAYCEWAGRRLPTEAQWEKSARGVDARIYPWGNQEPTCSFVNSTFFVHTINQLEEFPFKPCVGLTEEVGIHPNNASPYGALDMAGNVWEWVKDWFDKSYYQNSPYNNPEGPSSGEFRVIRGGSWNSGIREVYYRVQNYPDYGDNEIGFRCIQSP